MAFSYIGTAGSGTNTSSNQASGSLTIATNPLAVGNLAVLMIAVDNNQTTDGDEVAVTGVSDGSGVNTWIKAKEFTNGQGAVQGGATCSLWYCNIRQVVGIGNAITWTYSNATSRDASAYSLAVFSKAAGQDAAIEGTPGQLAADAALPGSLNVTTANIACLRIRAIASESSTTTTLTKTSAFTAALTQAVSGSGSSISNQGIRAEYLINTGTGTASAPTGGAGSVDHASVYVAFKEVPYNATLTASPLANGSPVGLKGLPPTIADLSTMTWSKLFGTYNVADSPAGPNTAERLTEDSTATQEHQAYKAALTFSAASYVMWAELKAETRGYASLSSYDGSTHVAMLDLAAGTVGYSSGITATNIVDCGGGWRRYELTVSGSAYPSGEFHIYMAADATVTGTVYSGDGTSSLLVGRNGLTLASDFSFGPAFRENHDTLTANGIATAPPALGRGPVAAQISTNFTSEAPLGESAIQRIGQTFLSTETLSTSAAAMWVKTAAAPTDAVVLDIYATSGGVPTGASLGTSNPVDASNLTTSFAKIPFTFASPISLSNATTYFAAVSRTGALDDTNFYRVAGQFAAGYNDGAIYYWDGASWLAFGDYDLSLEVGDFGPTFTAISDPNKKTLTAPSLATAAASLGKPAIAQTHVITANAIATAAASLGALPALTQIYVLTAQPLDITGRLAISATPVGSVAFGVSSQPGLGQTFTATRSVISSISASLYSVTPTDQLVATIYAADAGHLPTGPALATSNPLTVSNGSLAYCQFSFPAPISVTPSVEYVVTFTRTGPTDQNHYYFLGDTVNTYSGGTGLTMWSDFTWHSPFIWDFSVSVDSQQVSLGSPALVQFRPLWSPAYLSPGQLLAWYDANDAATLTVVSGLVSQWADKSGNAHHASQADNAKRPTYNATGLNGKPTVDCSATPPTWLGNATLAASGAFTIFVLAQRVYSSYYGPETLVGGDSTYTSITTQSPDSDGNFFGGIYDAGWQLNDATTANPRLFNAVFDDIRTNYFGDTIQSAAFPLGQSAAGTLAGFDIGARSQGEAHDGPISEVIVLTGSPTTDDRQLIEGYLLWKWGYEDRLPVGHPYKDAAPGSGGATSNSLTAIGIATAAASLASPALTQRHVLGAATLATQAASVGTPAIVPIKPLIAIGLATQAMAWGAATFRQAHWIVGSALYTGPPSLASGPITQKHVLSAAPLATQAASIAAPSILAARYLSPASIATQAASIGAPAIKQRHVLSAAAIATQAASPGTPAISQRHILGQTSIATQATAIGAPAISQFHVLGQTSIATQAAAIGTPAISQRNVLSAASIATQAASLAVPALGVSGQWTTDGIATQAAAIGKPAISQWHVLSAAAIATQAASPGGPALVRNCVLSATGIATGAVALGAPALQQKHVLSATAIAATVNIGASAFGVSRVLIPPQGDIVLSRSAPSVVNLLGHYRYPTAADISLSASAPVAFRSDPHVVVPGAADLTLTTLPVELTPGTYEYPVAANLLLTTSAPTVEITRLHHWRRVVSLRGDLVVTPELRGDIVVTHPELRGDIAQNHLLKAG